MLAYLVNMSDMSYQMWNALLKLTCNFWFWCIHTFEWITNTDSTSPRPIMFTCVYLTPVKRRQAL